MPPLAGTFLIAKPVLNDPNFVQTVVLLLQHGSDGAFGVVVNRPAEIQDLPFPVYLGGPCQAPGLILLHGEQEWLDADPPEVAAGIYLGDSHCFERATQTQPGANGRFPIFANYSR